MATTAAPQAIFEPRLLCGPGPANASPGVMEALARPPLGHLDPDIFPILLETADMLAAAYLRDEGDGMSIPLSSTGTSGMETGMAALLAPGDTAIVGVNGYFGRRLAEIARRYGASVIAIEADWGEAVSNDEILTALEANPGARLVAVVHAETSTGVRHDLAGLGEEMKGRETFLLADCVTSLGGSELRVSDWGVDYAYSCSQKCLGMSSGMSPISVSQRALDYAKSRQPEFNFYMDLALLEDYWINRPPTYHHTLASPMLFGMHEALREVLEEGLDARWERHAKAGGHLQDQIRERGMTLVADPDHQLAQLTAVHVPEGIDGKEVQLRMLRDHGIEIGGGLPGAPAMWRIGLMGTNATVETADRVLAALDAVLADAPVAAG